MRYALVLSFVLCGGCYLRHGLVDEDGGLDAGMRDGGAVDTGPLDAGSDAGDAGIDACVGPACDVVIDFDGLRWELPCGEHRADGTVCDTDDSVSPSFRARGALGARYDVTLRFRGVVETAVYSGGVEDGRFYVGGSHYGGAWNLYALEVSSPRQTYFLNSGTEGDYFCVAIDYTRVIQVDSNARVRLRARSIDGAQIVNRDRDGTPFVIPDVMPFPDAFDGQFIQMDVLEVREGS